MSTIDAQELLELLSEEETSRVVPAETSWLSEGDEFVDLDAVHRGVQRANATVGRKRHRVLARRAIHARTWKRVVARLG